MAYVSRTLGVDGSLVSAMLATLVRHATWPIYVWIICVRMVGLVIQLLMLVIDAFALLDWLELIVKNVSILFLHFVCKKNILNEYQIELDKILQSIVCDAFIVPDLNKWPKIEMPNSSWNNIIHILVKNFE